MSLFTTTAATGGIFPQEWTESLIVQPLREAAVAFDPTVSTRYSTHDSTVHIPTLTGELSTAYVPEGSDIPATDGAYRETIVTCKKAAGITVLSNEAASDSSPAAAEMLGQSLVSSLAAQIDAGFFGNLASTNPAAPAGLASIADADCTSGVTYPKAGFANLDPFVSAVAAAETDGGNIASWVVSPSTMVQLRQLKEQSTSNRGLLDPDPTLPTRSLILGRPVHVSHNAASALGTTVYGLDSSKVLCVLRDDTTVAMSTDAAFRSDSTVIRATVRWSPAFPAPKGGVTRIKQATS